MEEITFEVETVTPLFIAGADQRNIENEGLRAPSLRGLLRWWFRAIAGNYVENDVASLKKTENEIFGSTSSKSKVSLVMRGENRSYQITEERDSWDKAIIWSDYVDYFFFSCLDKRKDRETGKIKISSTRPFYPVKSNFTVIMRGREDELKIYLPSFWALAYLGGVGFRARRGGGCLKVKNVKGDTFGLDFICNDPNKLGQFLGENIEHSLSLVGELFKDKHCESLAPLPEYTMLSPSHSALFIKNINEKDWKSALDEIGRWYLGRKKEKGRGFSNGFRMRLADYGFSHEIEDAEEDRYIGLKSKERRPYLGLPVTYATYKATLKALKEKDNSQEDFDRRGSPLIFGVYEVGGNYIPRILIFRSMFLPHFNQNFVIEKMKKEDKKERKITLRTQLPHDQQLMKNCYEDLSKNNWQRVWGDIK